MQLMLLFLVIVPLLGFLASNLFKNHEEKPIAAVAIWTSVVQLILVAVLTVVWFMQGMPTIDIQLITVYHSADFTFGTNFYFDRLSAVYALLSAFIMLMVVIYSKTYMHRESGFKRFYNHLLFFELGLYVTIFAGNFETLFLGWELVGISSFLLISFYRERYLPVKNALKVVSFYRIGDVALVGALWYCHHLYHTNIHFIDFGHLQQHDSHSLGEYFILSMLFVVAALVKSAQFPFSSWLPRALEGPTASSAVFYGALSVNLGAFLLMRTYSIWGQVPIATYIIIFFGGLTALISSSIAAVQSTSKSQIGYSAITQIGLIFIEIALGWHILALVHLSCNALLRCYQFLVSGASMPFLIQKQTLEYNPQKSTVLDRLPLKWRNSIYLWSLKEWNLDFIWYQYIWLSFKKIGQFLDVFRNRMFENFFLLLLILGILFYIIFPLEDMKHLGFIFWIYGTISLMLNLIAWTERKSAQRSWHYLARSQVFFMLAIVQQHSFQLHQIFIYLSGTLGAYIAGNWCLKKIKDKEKNIDLNKFHGHIYEHPRYGLLFLVCSLTMIGFPISPTFLGLEILFAEIEHNHPLLLVLCSMAFLFLELAVLRIYARVFLGPHLKTYHDVAYRSS